MTINQIKNIITIISMISVMLIFLPVVSMKLFNFDPQGLLQSNTISMFYAVLIFSVLISAIISRVYKKEIKNYYRHSKKDILVFSVLALYFLLVIIYNTFFYSAAVFSGISKGCEISSVRVGVYYNPNQEELWPGQFEEAKRINNKISSSCYSTMIISATTILIAGFAIFVVLFPMAIIIYTELLLLILAVTEIKNMHLIKKLLNIDLYAKRIIFQMYYKDYPLNENNHFGLSSLNIGELNRQYEKEKEKINKYQQSIAEATKENLSILYEKVEAMFILLIIASYVLNIYLIASNSTDLFSKNFKLSVSLAISIAVFVVYISKILILLLNYNKEYATEFFQQKYFGDKLFLCFIILVIIMNILFLSLSFIELFGILYLMSYFFDMAYNKIVYKNILYGKNS